VALAGRWWFWAIVAALAGAMIAFGRRYPELAARARRAAVERGLVSMPSGQRLGSTAGGFPDLSWLALPVALWVIAAPWIWGYEDASGAIATDVATGAVVVMVALAAVVFPALFSLVLVAGLWLVLAPWIVGYGDANGPVGLNDVVAGILLCVPAVSGLAAAERQALTSRGGGTGRVRRPPG
jgi:hypothetical protein